MVYELCDEGWTYLRKARKAHYIADDGRSLCHKWRKAGRGGLWVAFKQDDDERKCAICRRKLANRVRIA